MVVSLLKLLHLRLLQNGQRFAAGTFTTPQVDEKVCYVAKTSNLRKAYSTTGNAIYLKWKEKGEEIFSDIEPILMLTKEILHSRRYMNGELLAVEDKKAVVEKLLAYHPHSEDKIGCGIESIMVDRHPQYYSGCLFVVRTDGGWIDFSYKMCLRQYIRDKYPSHAERFIQEGLKGKCCTAWLAEPCSS